MTIDANNSSISVSEYPTDAIISLECSPTVAAVLRIVPGVEPSFTSYVISTAP
jgi:hypothetical protein